MQPAHLLTDIPLVERHWGARGAGAYAFRSLLAAGHAVVFGSDVPVASIDPREGVYAALERRRRRRRPPAGGGREERLGFDDVPCAPYTAAAAPPPAARHRHRGTLAPGMDADFVAWAVDPRGRAGRRRRLPRGPGRAHRRRRGGRDAGGDRRVALDSLPHAVALPVRRTKIVATLGPAWDQPAQMAALLDAGRQRRPHQRVARHAGDPRPLDRAAARGASTRAARGAARSCSTCRGPGSGSATLPAPLRLEPGPAGRLRARGRGRGRRDPHDLRRSRAATSGSAPGSCSTTACCSLEVTGRPRRTGWTRWCTTAASSRPHKGMNLPGIEVSAPALTEKDLEDVRAGRGAGGGLHRALLRAPAGGHGAAARPGPAAHQAHRQDREGHGAQEPAAASSTPPTPSWWPAAISASSCRSRKCR